MDQTKQPYAPNGWVIDIYKYLTTTPSDFKLMKQIYRAVAGRDDYKIRSGTREIAYGNYDRVQLRAVNRFSDYSTLSSQAYDWFGTSQSILVYPLEEAAEKRSFLWGAYEKNGRLKVRYDGSKVTPPEGFFAVSFCYISDETRSTKTDDYAALLHQCKERLEQLVTSYNYFLARQADEYEKAGNPFHHRQVTAEFFGSFSSAEIVILWSAEQYTDILYLTDCIRDICVCQDNTSKQDSLFTLFRSTYTMISSPHVNLTDASDTLAEIRGEAYVQLVVQEGVGIDKIKALRQYIKRALQHAADRVGQQKKTLKLYTRDCAGEYDIIFRIESRYLPALFGNPRFWDKTAQDDGCPSLSIHSREFNKYILHTTTRLCYSEADLPDFARGKGEMSKEWETTKRAVCHIDQGMEILEGKHSFTKTWRSDLIRELTDTQRDLFDALMEKARERFPAISGFSAELDQLFSDYTQCCSTSADYLWIQDYHELFHQTMLALQKLVSYIPDRQTSIENATKKTALIELEQGLEEDEIQHHLTDINGLMEAIQQQTNHISASNKLFFKEQDIRFGYTAQHDLVIHAYYGIIKRLMEIIYQNSDPRFQSKLYPLVNFRPVNVLESQMFIEESAVAFQNEQKLSNRIVVTYMPLDGMNNIMHYLPMMIHEIYHYSAPLDRNGRNRLLAQFAVYQLLKEVWAKLFAQTLTKLQKEEKERQDKNSQAAKQQYEYQQKLASDAAEHIFLRETERALYRVIDQRGENIFCGIQRYSVVDASVPVLRTWFKEALENWLLAFPGSDEEIAAGELPSFNDLLVPVLAEVVSSIQREKNRLEGMLGPLGPGEQLFCNAADDLLRQTKSFGIYQVLMEAMDRIYHGQVVEQCLEQLDEVFPDCAMVTLTDMPVSGYLLQIALNLDMQFNSPRKTVNLRFGVLLHWMLSRQMKPGTSFIDAIETELIEFETLYCAAYQVSTPPQEYDEGQICTMARKWSDYYREMYNAYESEGYQLSFSTIQPWMTQLIKRHMLPALQVTGKAREPFLMAYSDYLKVLRLPEGWKRQNEMFKTSMRTILSFQSRRTIKSINEDFKPKSVTTPAPKLAGISQCTNLKPYELRALSFDHIHQLIALALEQLYQYRKKNGCADFTGMWYRGIQNEQYAVMPSGFVHFAEDANRIIGQCEQNKADYLSCLRHLYEVFRYSAEGAIEQTNPAVYTMVDHLALMQHYSQHTNLLDWSEDVYTSLYFALEDEITVHDKYVSESKKPKNFPNEGANAAIYILDPIRFNRACEEMEKELGFIFKDTMPSEDYRHIREAIPNLSIQENWVPFQEYHDVYQNPNAKRKLPWLTADRPAGSSKDACLTLADIPKGALRGHLPRAVYTSKLNPRIKAQSGLFVAFSMLSQPAKWNGEEVRIEGPNQSLFYYQSLESLQEYYLTAEGRSPFLFKIIIPKGLRKPAGWALYSFGMSKEKVYPELENRRNR